MSNPQSPYEALMLKAAQDETFREQLLKASKETLEAHLGTSLPDDFKVNVVENKPTEITLAIPPVMSDSLSDEELENVAGGNKIIGYVMMTIDLVGLPCLSSVLENDFDGCRERWVERVRTRLRYRYR